MSTWSYSNVGTPENPMQISSLSVTPDPPQGGIITLKIATTVQKAIKDGAFFNVDVMLGTIRYFRKDYNLFQELRKTDATGLKLSCDTSDGTVPIQCGPTVLTATINLGPGAPRTVFLIKVRAFTIEQDDLAALDIKGNFLS